MSLVIGIAIAAIVAVFARVTGFDRSRVFYPVVLIVVAQYYILFAAMGGSSGDISIETLAAFLFIGLAVAGFRISLWFAVGGLALHGVFDFLRHFAFAGSGVPLWWPNFCLGFDVAAAAILAAILISGRRPSLGEEAL
jgi:hypothetical protein